MTIFGTACLFSAEENGYRKIDYVDGTIFQIFE